MEETSYFDQPVNHYYEPTGYYCEDSSSDGEEEPTSADRARTFDLTIANADLNWRKFILKGSGRNSGKSGKSEISKDTAVFVAAAQQTSCRANWSTCWYFQK